MMWEETIAYCYLQQAGDEKNKCVLSSEHLTVIQRGRASRFALKDIKRLGVHQRRWLLPLVAGGIVAPFSLLAIFLNLYSLWPLFFLFIAASLAFYMGWMHHPVLSVQDQVKEHDFALAYVSDNLQAFVRFTGQFMRQGSEMIYHIALAEDWQQARQQGAYGKTVLQEHGFIQGFSSAALARFRQQSSMPDSRARVILEINPLKVQAEIRFERSSASAAAAASGEALLPHIYGLLNLDAVVKVEPLFTDTF